MSKYVEYVPECCYTCEYVPHVREYVRIRELGGHVLNLRIRGSRIFRVLTGKSIELMVAIAARPFATLFRSHALARRFMDARYESTRRKCPVLSNRISVAFGIVEKE